MNHDMSWGMARTVTSRRRRCLTLLGGVLLSAVLWASNSTSIALATATAADLPPVPGPGGTAIAGRCTQYEPQLAAHAPPGGWDVATMSAVMWRESKCTPTARSATQDTGLLQINDINHAHLRAALGEAVTQSSLTDPTQNIRAASELCRFWQASGRGCYAPWRIATPAPAAAAATTSPGTTPVVATAPAPIAGRCTQYESLLAANAPAAGWDVEKMSKLMSSTSGCTPTRRWSTATGLLRISSINATYLRVVLKAPIDQTTLQDPTVNIRSAAALCTLWRAGGKSCYAPWGATG
jgi:hypothetical protein